MGEAQFLCEVTADGEGSVEAVLLDQDGSIVDSQSEYVEAEGRARFDSMCLPQGFGRPETLTHIRFKSARERKHCRIRWESVNLSIKSSGSGGFYSQRIAER